MSTYRCTHVYLIYIYIRTCVIYIQYIVWEIPQGTTVWKLCQESPFRSKVNYSAMLKADKLCHNIVHTKRVKQEK